MAAKKKKSTSSENPPKKTTPKKRPVTKKVPTPIMEEELPVTVIEETTIITPSQKKKMKKAPLVMLGLVIIAIILLYVFRNQFVIATVNGQPISRISFNAEMQKEAGKKSMDALVTKTLILQEANKEHVTVNDKELNDRITQVQNSLKQQGQTLDEFLAAQGITINDFKEELKLEIMVEKMLGKKIQVSDSEVNDYIQKTQAANANTDTGATPTPALSKDEVRQQLQQQKLSQQVQPWLANLQQQAKISYFLNL